MIDTNFLWGVANSNVQSEGARYEGGKGENVYDKLIVQKEEGIRLETCDTDVASDHYHHYKEDIDLYAKMGIKAYRFSIVWSRVHPDGRNINMEGLKFYESMIDYLLEKHIEPIVSLVHFDMPYSLAKEYNGFLSDEVIELYEMHVKQVITYFKDKVKYWITYNEINLAPYMPYLVAGVKETTASKFELFSKLIINTQIAHAKAVNIIKQISPTSKVGGMIGHHPFYPKTSHPLDIKSSYMKNLIHNDLTFDIMTTGKFPNYFLSLLKRHHVNFTISEDNMNQIDKASKQLDFLSFSYYRSGIIEDNKEENLYFHSPFIKNPYLISNEWNWQIDEQGLLISLIHFYEKYHKPLFIVENGIAYDEKLENNTVNDENRIEYYRKHINVIKEAINDYNIDIIGYLAWSGIDFLSSHKEMRKRYGFIYVDRTAEDTKECKRYPKKSFYWYQKVIKTNGQDLM